MWTIHRFPELTSTNSYARKLLSESRARHAEVFQAEHQTAGRGRLADRTWKDERGEALLMSITLIEIDAHCVELVQFMGALAVASAVRALLKVFLHHFAGERVQIKWPNDVLLDGKKFCGILAEAVWQGEEFKGIVLGIGININQQEFPSELPNATSLASSTDATYSIEKVRDYILSEIASYLQRCKEIDTKLMASAIVSELQRELEWMRELPPFTLTISEKERVEGVRYEGLAHSGAIIVRMPDHSVQTVRAASLDIR